MDDRLSGLSTNVIDIRKDFDLVSLEEMKNKWTDIWFFLDFENQRMDVWLNGVKKWMKSQVNFNPEKIYFKHGIYRNWFVNNRKRKEINREIMPTQIVFNEIRIGNSIKKVDFNINPELSLLINFSIKKWN